MYFARDVQVPSPRVSVGEKIGLALSGVVMSWAMMPREIFDALPFWVFQVAAGLGMGVYLGARLSRAIMRRRRPKVFGR